MYCIFTDFLESHRQPQTPCDFSHLAEFLNVPLCGIGALPWSATPDMWDANFVPPNVDLDPADIKDGEVCSKRRGDVTWETRDQLVNCRQWAPAKSWSSLVAAGCRICAHLSLAKNRQSVYFPQIRIRWHKKQTDNVYGHLIQGTHLHWFRESILKRFSLTEECQLRQYTCIGNRTGSS